MRWIVASVAVMASFACSDRGQGRAASVVADSSGVRIVTQEGSDFEADVVVSQVTSLVPPDSALMALPWSVAADPRSGRIYVADQTSPRILVFGQDGEHLRTLGREGQGPAEFVNPDAVTVTPTGGIAVWDIGRNVVSRWSAAGEHVSDEAPPVGYWGPGFALEPDAIVTVTEINSVTTMDQQLIRVTGGTTAVLHSVPRNLDPVELPCGMFPMSPIYSPSLVWTHRGDAVHALIGPEYRIDRFVDGSLVASIRRELPPVRVTETLAAERAEMEYGGFLSACGLTPVSLTRLVGHAEFTSPIQAVSVDPDGRIWVSRTLDGVAPIHVDVFSDEGWYEGTVSSNGMPIAWLSSSRFVGFSVRPDTGETLVTIQDLLPMPQR